jgi:Cof subfamily protein (haloacid dehalogenase superfamily)
MKNYSKIMLLSDMDGTLLNSEGKVSKENQEAVDLFIAQGGKFGIATGRSQLNSVLFLDKIKINIPCILYNGGGLYDFDTEDFIALYELPKFKLARFLEFCLREYREIVIQIYCPKMCYFVSPELSADAEIVALHQPCEFTQINEIIEKPWIKILLSGNTEQLKALNNRRKDFDLAEDMNWVFSSEIYLEYLPYGVNKGSALSKLREYMGPEYKIYAVGDYNNDIEMLEAADVGIAMQNAIPSLKEIADVITVSNDESAIADIIYHIIESEDRCL